MSLNAQVLDSPVIEKLPIVEAELSYLIPMVEKPVNYTYEPPTGIPRHNGKYETRRLPIRDARPIAQNLSLDREGFAFAVYHSNVQNFYDDAEIEGVYYPEAEQLLKSVTGATTVVIFDHTLRNARRLQQGENSIKEPVKRVHNDFTAKSGHTRARRELAARGIDNIDELLQQRFAVVNIWRPIAPVQESPLAVCDAQSIAPTDLVPGDLMYRDRVGETYAITYNPTHRWFYFPQMQRDEVIFIKCFDSAEHGRARFAAHTGFDDPTTPSDAPPRESIELRAFVFYPA
jgi:hypothetical protein